MNDPRETTIFSPLMIEAFVVNDERALEDEVDALQDDGWSNHSVDERTAMASLVRDALLRMAEDVEEWLPDAAVAVSGESFGFFVWWKNRHLDEEIVRQRVDAELDATERIRDLERIAGTREQNRP